MNRENKRKQYEKGYYKTHPCTEGFTCRFCGRPVSPEGRMEKEMAVYDLLDELRIPYTRVDHGVAMTIEECQEVDQLLGIEICKNLVLCNAQKTKFYLLLMPGDKQFKTKDLSKQIGSSRLSFAPAEYIFQLIS